jgi:hypothetical protein
MTILGGVVDAAIVAFQAPIKIGQIPLLPAFSNEQLLLPLSLYNRSKVSNNQLIQLT